MILLPRKGYLNHFGTKIAKIVRCYCNYLGQSVRNIFDLSICVAVIEESSGNQTFQSCLFFIFSEPRRRQSVCRVGSQIFLFGGTSPHEGPHVYFTQEQLQFMPDNQPKNLIDHNDTYVLDLKPSLRSLCMDFVVQNSHHYNLECLPQGIKYDIDCMTKDDTISEPLKFKGLPLG